MKKRSFLTVILALACWPLQRLKAFDIWGPIITTTGSKVETAQFTIEYKILNSTPDPKLATADKRPVLLEKTVSKDSAITFPNVLTTLSGDELYEWRLTVADYFMKRSSIKEVP